MPQRIYIYRSGATNQCALTAVRSKPRLPPIPGPSAWQFWMQIGPLQAQGGRYGFEIHSAIQAIRTDGYHLFVGSASLLGGRVHATPSVSSAEEKSNA